MTFKTIPLIIALAIGSAATAQDQSTNRIAATADWSVYVEENPRECWAVSAPVETLNTRDGATVDVLRGDIQLIVFYQPANDIAGQVVFAGGYPFAAGSSVSMTIGETSYELFTEGDFAWAETDADDASIIAALKRGADAVLVGRSGRGTQTQDKFSLIGFTASVDEAASRCAG
jgi:hypothetical protein